MSTPQELPPACAAAHETLARFVGGATPADERAWLRAHLAGCPPCNTRYRELIEGVASLRGAVRRRRAGLQIEASTPPTPVPRRTLIAASTQQRFAVPRKFVLALCAVLVISLVVASSRGGVELRALAGRTSFGEVTLEAGGSEHDLQRALALTTDAVTRLELSHDDNKLAIEPASVFVIERHDRLRVRLFAGRMSIVGDVTIVTNWGVLTSQAARADVRITDGALVLECSAGQLALQSADGLRELRAGERLALPLAPMAARGSAAR